MNPPLAADDRPYDLSTVTTEDLPPTPTRDRNIAASAWGEAPAALLELGADIGIGPERTAYKRRIGTWLLWRAGPARGDHARYLAVNSVDLSDVHRFDLRPDGSGEGVGPSGTVHTRFRTWKEDLLGRI